MILFIVLFFGLYLAAVQMVVFVIKALRPGCNAAGIVAGGVIACGVVFVIVLAAFLIFESDENYWYYATDWRSPLLFGGAVLLSLTALISGPILGKRIAANRK